MKTKNIIKEISKILDGMDRTDDVPKDIEKLAKENNIIIIFGYSDDLIEVRGKIYDEFDIFDGDKLLFTSQGILSNECYNKDCENFKLLKTLLNPQEVKAIWRNSSPYWSYQTDIPHKTFRMLDSDDEIYCIGIVFSLSDIK